MGHIRFKKFQIFVLPLRQLCCCYFCCFEGPCFIFVFLYVQYAAHGPYTSCSWYDFQAKTKINENDFCWRFIDLFFPIIPLRSFVVANESRNFVVDANEENFFIVDSLLCSPVTHSSRITCLQTFPPIRVIFAKKANFWHGKILWAFFLF